AQLRHDAGISALWQHPTWKNTESRRGMTDRSRRLDRVPTATWRWPHGIHAGAPLFPARSVPQREILRPRTGRFGPGPQTRLIAFLMGPRPGPPTSGRWA